jgi:hypothetical protein
MLSAVQSEDKAAFVELSKALITGIGPMFAFSKRYKVHREENALRNALFVREEERKRTLASIWF